MTPLLWPALIYAVLLLLHAILPARRVQGYVIDPQTGNKLRYRLNGPTVAAVALGCWATSCRLGWIGWDALYLHRWEMAGGACMLGLLLTLAIVLTAPPLPARNLLRDLYLGRLENPQLGAGWLDAKVALYLLGAVMLELNVLSFAAHHVLVHAHDPSPGVLLYAALFSFFVFDYLVFEEVHLYTYDFMAERVGFKLVWGCLVFYPFFYCIGLWLLADAPNPQKPRALLALDALTFFGGWMLSRGANLQKFRFKRDPSAKAFGFMDPAVLSAGGKHVLTGGFWGVSRHINYLGEILMAIGLTLSLGYPLMPVPWLYPLYYVALLVPRQADDDRRCAARYGALWDEYCRRVPWRIVPYLY